MKRPRDSAKEKGRGPVEIIKEKTTSIPIYDAGDGKFIAAYYAEGKRRLVKYKSLEAAKAGAKEIIRTLTTGVAHVAAFTPKETASINDAVDILKPCGVTLTEAVRQYADAYKALGGGSVVSAAQFYAKHLEEENRRGALTPITFPELVTKFIDSIKGTKSSRYVLDLNSKLTKAAKTFRGSITNVQRFICRC